MTAGLRQAPVKLWPLNFDQPLPSCVYDWMKMTKTSTDFSDKSAKKKLLKMQQMLNLIETQSPFKTLISYCPVLQLYQSINIASKPSYFSIFPSDQLQKLIIKTSTCSFHIFKMILKNESTSAVFFFLKSSKMQKKTEKFEAPFKLNAELDFPTADSVLCLSLTGFVWFQSALRLI